MQLSTLIQILNRPWLMEQSQAQVWAGIAEQVLFNGASLSSLAPQAGPGRNPLDWRKDARYANPSSYQSFYRVNSSAQMDPAGEVLIVEVNGPVMKADYCGAPGMESIGQAITAANADDTISSIMLRIDSPGGTVDGTHNLARIVAASPKATVSHVNGMMASAAYWIGSSAREVISDDANAGHNATIGSIGTMAQYVDMTQAYAQKGIKVNTIYATKSKRKHQAQREVMEGNYSRLQAELDALNDTFITSVQANRAGKLKSRGEDVFEGDVYNAQDAIKYGLIDKIGNFQYAVKRSLQLAKIITK